MAHRRQKILVINPNANEIVTKGLSDALEPLRFAGGPLIECVTNTTGPVGVETQEHVESVTLPLRRMVMAAGEADAFVIACYSDPGLHVCREATTRPVFGINESGVLTALARGERFGVIAIKQRSIRRHVRYMRQMGLLERLAGERPLEMSVAETAVMTGPLKKTSPAATMYVSRRTLGGRAHARAMESAWLVWLEQRMNGVFVGRRSRW